MNVHIAFRVLTSRDGAQLMVTLGVFGSCASARRATEKDAKRPGLMDATKLLDTRVSYQIREEEVRL